MKCCKKYVPALSALIDGELNDTERAEVLTHLEKCETCRGFFAELTAMHDALGELEEFDAPEGFAESVIAQAHAAPAAKKRTHRTAWLSIAACAAVLLIAVGVPLRDAHFANDSAAPEAAMLMMTPAAEPESEECTEEEYKDEFTSVQSAPRTMVTMDSTPAENGILTGASDYKEKVSEETGEADSAANDALFANEAELPRSVVFVYGAAHEDYLIEEATGFDYYANGITAGYDLPVEKLDEFLALLDADGVQYDSSVAKQTTTFYVQYEEGNENG